MECTSPYSGTVTYEKPDKVRIAGRDDEDAIYDLLMALDQDNSFGVPYQESRVRSAIEKGTRGEGSIIGIIDGGDELAASVCLTFAQFWYSEEWYLAEQWLFVRPDYRQNRFEADLFAFAKWCQSKLGDGMLLISSVSSPARLPAKLRLWGQYGRQIGGIFSL